MVTPTPPNVAPPMIVPLTPMNVASSTRRVLSPSSTEGGAVMEAPLERWSVLLADRKMLCEG